MTLKRVDKVVCYITCGDQLLVFRHRDFPEVGIQVPSGTIDAGEGPAVAALREAMEETGLSNIKVIRALGVSEYDISVLRPELHRRHFYHLEAAPPVPEKWPHAERHPSGGDMKEIWFDCYWADLRDVPELSLGFGALLGELKQNISPPKTAHHPKK